MKFVVCLAVDIEGYSVLDEELGFKRIHVLMKKHLAAVFSVIERRNGRIYNIVANKVYAFWVSENDDPKLRQDACYAALEIQSALARLNTTSLHAIPTRIGLHCGEASVGFSCAGERLEWHVTGSTPNCASRIEQLNELLDTRILASTDVAVGLIGVISRERGSFPLRGVKQRVVIYEILGTTAK